MVQVPTPLPMKSDLEDPRLPNARHTHQVQAPPQPLLASRRRMQGTVAIALEEARLAVALVLRLLPGLAASPAWGRLQPGLFRLAWLYGRLNARVTGNLW